MLNLKISDGYGSIERTLESGEGRTFEQYVQKLVLEKPGDETELSVMASLYHSMERGHLELVSGSYHPDLDGIDMTSSPIDIPDDEDIDLELRLEWPVGGCPVDWDVEDHRSYNDFRSKSAEATTGLYKDWQRSRMDD